MLQAEVRGTAGALNTPPLTQLVVIGQPMLPTHDGNRRAPRRSTSLLPTYLRRIIKPQQMDLE